MRFESPTETLRQIQFWLVTTVLVLAPLFFGSVDQLSVAAWTILLSLSTLCGWACRLSRSQVRVLFGFLLLCGAYAVACLLQIIPGIGGGWPSDPIWQRAREFLQLDVASRVSSRAEIPSALVGHVLLFVMSFLCGFLTGTSRRNAAKLIGAARNSILLYTIYGLVALALTPDLILWEPKLAYQGSLTATFVNHNTAATYIGAGVVLWFCSACNLLQSIRYPSFRMFLLASSSEALTAKALLHVAAGLICFLALLLTGSRGGLISSCLGLLVALSLMVINRVKPKLWHAIVALLVGSILMAVWLSQAGQIASKGAFDDARWVVYRLCIKVALEHPWLGTGAGSFPDIFPSVRTDELVSWGVWDYAHSTILEIAVEMGIPIAAMVLVASLASLVFLARSALSSTEQSLSLLFPVIGILVLSYSHSLIDFSLQVPGYFIVVTILLGCASSRATAQSQRLSQTEKRTC